MDEFEPTVNVGKEIAEISRDFSKPEEVLREAIANSYDALADCVWVKASAETFSGGTRGLSLEIKDNGKGMTASRLKNLFGLGYSEKDQSNVRAPIGYKGHGTKTYYQAAEIVILTKTENSETLIAHLESARQDIYDQRTPKPKLYHGEEAEKKALQLGLSLPSETSGTAIRLVDFTPNSLRLIDSFNRRPIENYIKWFTIFGSFEKCIDPAFTPPLKLLLQATDETKFSEVNFGHNWPDIDLVDLRTLKTKDSRRPFNYFRKTIIRKDVGLSGGYKMDIAAIFEGARGRKERDPDIRRQGVKGLYLEDERYGLWLCRDYIPIEKQFDWLNEEDCPLTADLSRPLLLVNCQSFSLTANRGSVGNSGDVLLPSVKAAVFEFLKEVIENDKDLKTYYEEYREDLFSRLRNKDKQALQKRIERHNRREYCTITLPNKSTYSFFSPTREITLFGLISELMVIAPEILGIKWLDYDDHVGIDLLVQRENNPSDLLDKTKVAYTELKYSLESRINHPFENLHSIICWESFRSNDSTVIDPTGDEFFYKELDNADGVTHTQLTPPPTSKLTNTVRVVVLKRLLQQVWKLTTEQNPNQIQSRAATAANVLPGNKGRKRKH